MIPLVLRAQAEPGPPYVVKLVDRRDYQNVGDKEAVLVADKDTGGLFAGANGLFEVEGPPASELIGDIVLMTPEEGRVERLIRSGSVHNTLLTTEQCDQLCVMCSQPPKKTHHDRFEAFAVACRLADRGSLIGISGGEPTLHKAALFGMVEDVLSARPDLSFHILSNGQHFTDDDIERLSDPLWRNVAWGIPLYASDDNLHDSIVGKSGAATRLRDSLARLFVAGSRVELRTVVIQDNLGALPHLAEYIATFLPEIEQWSIMQLENAGFARNRWAGLFADHVTDFRPIGRAIDRAELSGVVVRLFNFPRCTVPIEYRDLAVASISDWKRRYVDECSSCREKTACSGFFEWHPAHAVKGVKAL